MDIGHKIAQQPAYVVSAIRPLMEMVSIGDPCVMVAIDKHDKSLPEHLLLNRNDNVVV